MSDHDADSDAEAHADDGHAGHGDENDDHAGHGDEHEEGRVTSPMQEFGSAQVTTGLVVLAVGLLVVFGVPLLL